MLLDNVLSYWFKALRVCSHKEEEELQLIARLFSLKCCDGALMLEPLHGDPSHIHWISTLELDFAIVPRMVNVTLSMLHILGINPRSRVLSCLFR